MQFHTSVYLWELPHICMAVYSLETLLCVWLHSYRAGSLLYCSGLSTIAPSHQAAWRSWQRPLRLAGHLWQPADRADQDEQCRPFGCSASLHWDWLCDGHSMGCRWQVKQSPQWGSLSRKRNDCGLCWDRGWDREYPARGVLTGGDRGTVMWGMGENDAWMGKGKSTWWGGKSQAYGSRERAGARASPGVFRPCQGFHQPRLGDVTFSIGEWCDLIL